MSDHQYPQYDPNATSGIRDDDRPIQKPPQQYRRVYRVVAYVVAAFVAVALLVSLWPKPVPNVPSPERTIPTTTTSPTADILSRIDQAYGPWKIVASGVDAPGKVLLIDTTGAMKAGKELPADNAWQPTSTPIITDKTFNLSKGTVTFRLSETVTVTVLANQAFILKQAPELLYMYRDGGNLVAKPIGV
jgi:hypothetical protein